MSRDSSLAAVQPAPPAAPFGRAATCGARPVLMTHFDPAPAVDRCALAEGFSPFDGIEVDVRVCRTGEPVVFARDRLGVFKGRAYHISGCGLHQAREIAARSGERVLTLSELLSLARHSELSLLSLRLLCRGGAPAVLAALQRVVARGRLHWDGILLSSPIWSEPALVNDLNLGVTTGLVTETEEADYAMIHQRLRPDCFFVAHEHADPARVSFLHDLGTRVFVWKADTEADVRRGTEIGVDGIVVDRPLPLGRRSRGLAGAPPC